MNLLDTKERETERERERDREREREREIRRSPIVSGMRTPVCRCYHVYSNVSNKNACRGIDSDLTTHMILDLISRRFGI